MKTLVPKKFQKKENLNFIEYKLDFNFEKEKRKKKYSKFWSQWK